MQLKHSNVKRGGVTSPYWYGSTADLDGDIAAEGLRLRFTLPSKGGGDTQIQVTVGPEDLRPLLKQLAAQNLSLADTFAECTQIAVDGLLGSHRSRVA